MKTQCCKLFIRILYGSCMKALLAKENIIIPYNFLSGMPDKSRETQIMPSLELKLDSNGKYL